MSNVEKVNEIISLTSFGKASTASTSPVTQQDPEKNKEFTEDGTEEVDAKELASTSYNLKVIQGPSKSYASPITNQKFNTSYDLLPKMGASTSSKMNGFIKVLNQIGLQMDYTYLTDDNNKEIQQNNVKGKVKYTKQFIRLKQKRRMLIQPRLFRLLYFAFLVTQEEYKDLDHVSIYSGGQAPLYDSGKSFEDVSINKKGKFPSRVSSTTIRHDKGFAADIHLKNRKGKTFSLKKPEDFNLIRTFIRNCYSLGAGGIGAHEEYESGTGIHVDISRLNPEINTSSSPYNNLSSIDAKTRNLLENQVKKSKTASSIDELIKEKIKSTQNSRAWGKNSSSRNGNLKQWLKELKDEHALK